MEEKELVVTLKREEENVVFITSNFEDDLELFELEEITPIILDLLNCLMKKVKKDILEQEVGTRSLEDIDEDESQKILNKVTEVTANYIGNLFLEIINFVNNVDSEEPKPFDYSIAVYGISEHTKRKEVYETYHFGNLANHEKLLSCLAFYKDIAGELLISNSKEQIKTLFEKVFTLMISSVNNYIDNYNTTNEN